MKRSLPLITALLLGSTAHAAPGRPPVPPLTDAQIAEMLEPGEELETRVDGDLNGDGDVDTAYVVRSPDARTLYVSLAYRSEVELGHERAGHARLASDALGAADLSIARSVLVVKDLTGGTTALSTAYRYRFDKPQSKMRLIGLDTKLYSRTWAHDGSEMSWNLLTGDIVTSDLKLQGIGENANYETRFTRKAKRPVKTVFIENTPDPEEELIRATKSKQP